MKQKINIVWFKRDLRLKDHEALQKAIAEGLPILLCYIFEPSLIQYPKNDVRHWRFVWQSLEDLQAQLAPAGVQIFYEEALTVFEKLTATYEVKNVFSHQETGNLPTFERDKCIGQFLQKKGIVWQEFIQDGVTRGMKNRFGWQEKVDGFMNSSVVQINVDKLITLCTTPEISLLDNLVPIPSTFKEKPTAFQIGGEQMAWRYWRSFKDIRYPNYMKHISKPALSRKSCSRMSPYLAYGNVSVRQLYQETQELLSKTNKSFPLKNFQSRLWWRGHFTQKFESDYEMEFKPCNRGFVGMKTEQNESYFTAWETGNTGYPMVDACMRCLEATGYVNFRMRAMLTCFAQFTLWLNYKAVAKRLANVFLDYDPGIHYPQLQMQGGLTGYSTLRIYSPTVQSQKNDTDGVFVKKWVPELANVPTALLYEPWKMTALDQAFYHCEIGRDYPAPIVHFETATKKNKDYYWEWRQSKVVQDKIPEVLKRFCVPTD